MTVSLWIALVAVIFSFFALVITGVQDREELGGRDDFERPQPRVSSMLPVGSRKYSSRPVKKPCSR